MRNRRLHVFAPLMIFVFMVVVLLAIESGRAFGLEYRLHQPQAVHSSIEGAIFGLIGLLVGFTFSGAAARFDHRRKLVVDEANAISKAYHRLDLLPAEKQPALRTDFPRYVRSRLAVNDAIPSTKAVKAALNDSRALQNEMWRKTVEGVQGLGPSEKTLVLSSMNEVIEITTVATAAYMEHPPAEVFAMLFLTVIVCSALAGYEMSAAPARDWVSTISFAFVLGIALYVILDYEFPRVGFIRVDPMDQMLIETLGQME